MYLSLPHITRENPPEGYMEQVKKVAGSRAERISCAESGVLQCTGTDGTGRQVCAGSLPVYLDDEAIRFWKDQGILRNTVPLELNEKELRHRENAGSEMIVYGRLPLMHSAQCVRKNTFGCNGQERGLF